MMQLADLSTPTLVLDERRMRRNIARMADRAAELGVPLRPHGKTPKCVEIARIALERQARGLTVSTLREAEAYFAGGVTDLFYAVGLAPGKVERVAALITQGADLTCLVDHPIAAHAIAERGRSAGAVIPLVIEVDVDGYRAGIDSNSPAFVEMARFIHHTDGVSLRGVMCYGGASYGCTPSEARALAETHRLALIAAKTQLESEGLPCPVVSFGSSPAVLHAASMEGVTELRCGIYIFQDLFQAAIDACGMDDIAVSVLTTVIGSNPERNRVIIDAGGMAMSKDVSTARTARDAGYGLVCDANGKVVDDVFVATTSQELGLVTTFSGRPLPFERLAIGTKLRILPNHADMTAAAYDHYHVIGEQDEIVAQWQRANGW